MKFDTILVAISLFLVLISTEVARGQECGPGCPACSGKAVGDLMPPETIFGSILYIPDSEEETAVLKFRYGLFSWMDVGIGYALDTEEPIWSVRVLPIAQDRNGWRPGLIIGTGSVQTGGSDQSGYFQIVKKLDVVKERLEINLAGGYATDLPDFEENWVLGTVSMTLFEKAGALYTYDGVNSHIGLSFFATEWLTLTGYVLEMEEPALSVGVQWGFGEKK
ncbi:MAG: hypothetical protein B6244_12715 [Candidatus Cloacimonetes bacterium 4572_55]|nr:MAG: hypothetical protein B6244_12715 [Candidatus Cloacimonetes bacterium 4572_55]